MSTVKRITVLVLIAVLALAAVPALAQSATATIAVTEQQANQAYLVTNPVNRTVSNVSVDFQPGQVVIEATVTLRRQAPPVDVTGTFVPEVRGGRVYWTATAVTAGGQPVSGRLLVQINNAIAASWRAYIRTQMPAGRVTDVAINDTEMIVSYACWC